MPGPAPAGAAPAAPAEPTTAPVAAADPPPATPPPAATPATPAAVPQKWEDAPEWFKRRLKAASRNAADRAAREAGFRNWQAMLEAAAAAPGAQVSPGEPPARTPADAQRLKSRVQQLEQQLADVAKERQQEQGLHVIQTEALRAGITGPVAGKAAMVLFTDHMEQNEERFRGITPEKLAEEARSYFESIRQAQPALFAELDKPATTGPPGGTSPPPASSPSVPTSDMDLPKEEFRQKFRRLTASPS